MATERPFALLVTWTCYGTRLPGNTRGHVSNVLLPEGSFLSDYVGHNRRWWTACGSDRHVANQAEKLAIIVDGRTMLADDGDAIGADKLHRS